MTTTIRTWPIPENNADNNSWGIPTHDILAMVAGFIAPEGLVGDGVADDTAALQAAIVANTKIYLKEGTYKITAPITGTAGCVIQGAGMGNTTFVVTGNFTLFPVTLNAFELRDCTITSSVAGQGVGVSCNQYDGSVDAHISSVWFSALNTGFLGILSTSLIWHVGSTISHCYFQSCTYGVNIPAECEYVGIFSCNFFACGTGIKIIGGNSLLVANNVSDCTTGLELGNGPNDSHGMASACNFNHNTTNIYSNNIQFGYSFCGCHSFDGVIYIKTSTGFKFTNGMLGGGLTVNIEGGDWNLIANNGFQATVTINRDYNSVADFAEVVNNRAITSHDNRV